MTDELFAARAQPTHWQPLPQDPEEESIATHEMGAERSGASPSSPTSGALSDSDRTKEESP